MFYFIDISYISNFLYGSNVRFNYEIAPFVQLLPEGILEIALLGLIIACVFIVLGKFYKIAMGYFLVVFTYFFLLDKAYYNNHIYLICLLALLLLFIPADNTFSWKKQQDKKPVFYWHLLVLRLQIALVYFFGGVSKLNKDWVFNQEPSRFMLHRDAIKQSLGGFFTTEPVVYFFTYGGIVFDLLVGFLLFNKTTRKPAIITAIFFNLTNAWLFDDINIFPFFMICALLLFLDPDKVAQFIRSKAPKNSKKSNQITQQKEISKATVLLIGVYFLIQLALPLRHYFISGNTDWTGYGQRFAWRMKIQHRSVKSMEFMLYDVKKQLIYPVALPTFGITIDQERLLSQDPRAIVQFARFLEQYVQKNKGMEQVEVRSQIIVSFNNREEQLIFPTALNLLTLRNDAMIKDAILPLKIK